MKSNYKIRTKTIHNHTPQGPWCLDQDLCQCYVAPTHLDHSLGNVSSAWLSVFATAGVHQTIYHVWSDISHAVLRGKHISHNLEDLRHVCTEMARNNQFINNIIGVKVVLMSKLLEKERTMMSRWFTGDDNRPYVEDDMKNMMKVRSIGGPSVDIESDINDEMVSADGSSCYIAVI